MPAVVQTPNVQTPGARSGTVVAMAPTREDITTAYQSALQGGRAPAAAAPPAAIAAPAAPVRRLDPDELATLMTRAKGLLAATFRRRGCCSNAPPTRKTRPRHLCWHKPTIRPCLERRMPATSFRSRGGAHRVPAGRAARLGRGAAPAQPNAIAFISIGDQQDATFNRIGNRCQYDGLWLRGAGR